MYVRRAMCVCVQLEESPSAGQFAFSLHLPAFFFLPISFFGRYNDTNARMRGEEDHIAN